MSSNRLRLLFVIAVILTAANFVFLQRVTHPLSRSVQDQKELERKRLAQMTDDKRAYENLVEQKRSLDRTLADVSYFFGHMVTGEKEGYEKARRALQKQAEDTGIAIQAIGYSIEDKGPQQLVSMSMTFQVTGAYDQIRKFLTGLERSEVLLIVESIDLKSAGESGDSVTLSLRVSTLFRKTA